MYVHPNFIVRDIFWQRLEAIKRLMNLYISSKDIQILDFGGGSGVLSWVLRDYSKITVIDIDVEDCVNIKEHFKLNNIEIIRGDIQECNLNRQFDVILAADVLEHFKDLSIPVEFIKRHIKNNGYLIVSLPTENHLYEFGRKLIRKSKPIDHYHRSKDVIEYLKKNGFSEIRSDYIPVYLTFRVPLFEVGIFLSVENSKGVIGV